jgi:hypothetical protein
MKSKLDHNPASSQKLTFDEILFANAESIPTKTSQAGIHISDNNCCFPTAVANVTGIRYIEIFALCKKWGRDTNKGTPWCTIAKIATHFNMTRVLNSGYSPTINSTPGFHTTVFDKDISPKDFVKKYPTGRYVVIKHGHAYAIIDGVIVNNYPWDKMPSGKIFIAFRYDGPIGVSTISPTQITTQTNNMNTPITKQQVIECLKARGIKAGSESAQQVWLCHFSDTDTIPEGTLPGDVKGVEAWCLMVAQKALSGHKEYLKLLRTNPTLPEYSIGIPSRRTAKKFVDLATKAITTPDAN